MSRSLFLDLAGPGDTSALGRTMAEAMPKRPGFAILLYGELGAGKTSLVRSLVLNLPGGDEAEVASPSFNIVNYYPTSPEVAHFDLYRLEATGPDEAFYEAADDPSMLVAVEWAEHIPANALPASRLEMRLNVAGEGRRLEAIAHGEAAENFLEKISEGKTS